MLYPTLNVKAHRLQHSREMFQLMVFYDFVIPEVAWDKYANKITTECWS